MSAHLRRDHEELLESLVSGKLPRNLPWNTVVDLIGQIGTVKPHGNDEFTFTVGSHSEVFRRATTHNLDVDEIARLRHFLRAANLPPQSTAPQPLGRIIVVIDHHVAHLWHDTGAPRPEGGRAVQPYDPYGFQHHLIHRKEAHYKGERVPEEDSWYEAISHDLAHAASIILIGHATGTSNAAVFLSDYLKSHHPETFQRIVATETADLSALTEPEIEQIAQKHRLPH